MKMYCQEPHARYSDYLAEYLRSGFAVRQIGSITKVEFYAATTSGGATVNTLIGSATTGTRGTYSYAWSNVPAGSYILTAVATDNYGYATTSSPVSVTVKPGELQPYYIHADQLDTPREITDTNANVVWQWNNMDPFGNNVPNENPSSQGQFKFNLRFPGQYADRETNLAYNYFRDYDPGIGRYIQSDPIGLWGGVNTYTYVGGNPLRWVDSLGLICIGQIGNKCVLNIGNIPGNLNPGMVGGYAPGLIYNSQPADQTTGGTTSLPSPGSNANTPNSDAVPLPPPDSWPICQVTGTCTPESMGFTTPMSLPTASTPINNTPTSTSSSCQ